MYITIISKPLYLLSVADAGPEDALVVLAAEAVGLAGAPLAPLLVAPVRAVLLAVADPLRVHATCLVAATAGGGARNLSHRAIRLPPEAVVLVAAVHAVPLAVAAPLTKRKKLVNRSISTRAILRCGDAWSSISNRHHDGCYH